jgi:hypothetical protein
MDCSMPFVDGYQASSILRNLWGEMGIKREL